MTCSVEQPQSEAWRRRGRLWPGQTSLIRPLKGQRYPPKRFFFRFEPQKSIQQMWVQSSKEDFVANRTIVETTSFFGAKCVISSQNLWAGNGGNKFDQKCREPFRFSKMVRKWESDQPQNHAKVTP